MLQENRINRRTTFRKRNYSFSKDFFLFVVAVGFSVAIFYWFVYRPIFAVPEISGVSVHAIYEISELKGGSETKFVQKVWHYGDSIYVENATLDTAVKYIYSGSALYQDTEQGVRKLERALNPLFFPFSPALYRFIENHREHFLDLNIVSNFPFAGRDAILCEFSDWFKPDRKYRFIIDKKTYLPLYIGVREDERQIFTAETTFFFDEVSKDEKPFRINSTRAKDLFVNARLEAGEVQYSVPFSVYPPGWVPADLDRTQILRLERYRPALSSTVFNAKSILFSYYNEEKFLHVLEYRGIFPAKTVKNPYSVELKGRLFKIATIPGAFLAWGKDGNVTIVVVTNLTKAEMIRVIERLFE